MKAWRGVAAGAALSALLVACAAGQKTAAMAPAATDAGLPEGRANHAEIQRLADAIEAQQQGQDLAPWQGDAVPLAELAVCKPPASDKCRDSCTLGDSICDNAKKICDLAKSMPGDAWAASKCDDGTKSCDAAHQRCCDCS